MKVLLVLIMVFLISISVSKLGTGHWNHIIAGNFAMCIMLCFTASGHFLFKEGMTMMIPGIIPFKKMLVYFTGMLEITLAIGLIFPSTRSIAAIILVIFFILVLPANIFAAIKHLNIETATYNGKGIKYLFLRIPLQIFFILWVLYFSFKH